MNDIDIDAGIQISTLWSWYPYHCFIDSFALDGNSNIVITSFFITRIFFYVAGFASLHSEWSFAGPWISSCSLQLLHKRPVAVLLKSHSINALQHRYDAYEFMNVKIVKCTLVLKWSKMIQNAVLSHTFVLLASSEFHFFRFFRLFQHSTRWQGSGSCSKTRSCGHPLGWSFPWSMLSWLSCWSGLKT